MSELNNTLSTLIYRAGFAIKKAKEVGDQELVFELERLKEELQHLRRTHAMSSLASNAAELASLTAEIEKARKILKQRTESFFLSDVSEAESTLNKLAAKIHKEEKLAPADSNDTNVIPSNGTHASPASLNPPTLVAEYQGYFDQMAIRDTWKASVSSVAKFLIKPSVAKRYRVLAAEIGVPWWAIAIIHMMEASLNFDCHLHNGDPLTGKTVNHPRGRPVDWKLGMTWEQSAADALTTGRHQLQNISDWSIGNFLLVMEKYNGFGYRNRGLMSPYLWSGSTYFDKGKFVSDGKFDPDAESKQVGCAVLLRCLIDMGALSVGRSKKVETEPAAITGNTATMSRGLPAYVASELQFPFNKPIKEQFSGRGKAANAVTKIQEWCNAHHCNTSIDNIYGTATTSAVTLFQARNNLPQTGEVDKLTWALLVNPMQQVIDVQLAKSTLNNALIHIAKIHLNARPREIGGQNMGPWVRLYMEGKQGTNQKWCAGFVCFVLLQAKQTLGLASLPFPRQVSVDKLVSDAKKDGRFIAGASLVDPILRKSKLIPGSLFVDRNPKDENDWTHVGIVLDVNESAFWTIEGNASSEGVDGVYSLSRSFEHRDFILLV